MTVKVIPLIDHRVTRRLPNNLAHALSLGGALPDTLGRLSIKGKLYTCLFVQSGHDLRALNRSGKSDEKIAAAMGLI